jgi:hypothetical protein
MSERPKHGFSRQPVETEYCSKYTSLPSELHKGEYASRPHCCHPVVGCTLTSGLLVNATLAKFEMCFTAPFSVLCLDTAAIKTFPICLTLQRELLLQEARRSSQTFKWTPSHLTEPLQEEI